MTLKKRLFQNGMASIFQKGVKVLEQLFLVPFFISAWGAAYYGEWLTLTIIPSVIAFSDLGFGTAAGNSFVLSYASGDKQKAANISKTGFLIISLMVVIAMVISIIALLVLNYFDVFQKSLIDKYDAIIAVSIMILARLLNFYLQLFQSYYRAAQKAALSINLMSISAALNLGAGLLVLLMGYGVVAFAVSQLAVILVFNVYYWYQGRKVLGLYQNYVGLVDKTVRKDITTKGLSYLMLPMWQVIYFQGTTFVVRIVLGAEAVAIFNTLRTLSRSLNQLFFMIKSTVFPELQFEIGTGNWTVAKRIFRVALLGVFLLSSLGFLFLLFFGLDFYNIWTNNELQVEKPVWYVFISGMLLNALWWTTEMVFGAVNKPYKLATFGVAAALTSVGLTYVFSNYLGLLGAAIGAVSLDFILVLIIIPLGCKLMHMSVTDLFKHGLSDFRAIGTTVKLKVQNFKK